MTKIWLKVGNISLLFIIIAITAACGFNLTNNPRLETAPAAPLTPPPSQQFIISPIAVDSGLKQLESYRAMLIFDFEGTLQGQPTSGHLEALTEVTRQPIAMHRAITIDGNLPQAELAPGVSEFFQVNNKTYLKKAKDDLWVQFSGDNVSSQSLEFFEPEQFIKLPATVSTPPVPENLDDLSVQHYRFNETDLAGSDIIFERAQGEVWIASPGNYVVQYVISASLRMTLPDPSAHLLDEGSITLHYTLTDIDSDFAIRPPANILTNNNSFDTLPRLPDAELISIFPTLLEYTSAISAISATLFYRDELSALDWTEESAEIFNEKADLRFSQEDQTLRIIITPAKDDQKTNVLLSLEAESKPDLLKEE